MIPTDRNEFAAMLKRLIITKGVSQRKAAEEIGVRYNTMLSWLAGRSYPRAEALAAIQNYFDMNGVGVKGAEIALESVFLTNVVTFDGKPITESEREKIYQLIKMIRD